MERSIRGGHQHRRCESRHPRITVSHPTHSTYRGGVGSSPDTQALLPVFILVVNVHFVACQCIANHFELIIGQAK